jgi:hypothetical protein
MNNISAFYSPDFVPKISPVKKGLLIHSKLSTKMKKQLDRELATREAEYKHLQKLKKDERTYIGRFHQYILSKRSSKNSILSISKHKLPLPKQKSFSPFLKDLLEVQELSLNGIKFESQHKSKFFGPNYLYLKTEKSQRCSQRYSNDIVYYN